MNLLIDRDVTIHIRELSRPPCPHFLTTTSYSASKSLRQRRKSGRLTRKSPSGTSSVPSLDIRMQFSACGFRRTHPDRLTNATPAERQAATERFQVCVAALHTCSRSPSVAGSSGRVLCPIRLHSAEGVRRTLCVKILQGEDERPLCLIQFLRCLCQYVCGH